MSMISIIVPCFNVESKIVRCLESVCAQTYQDIETVIVNDASEDNTLFVIRRFIEEHPSLSAQIVSHVERQGVSVSRNDGLNAARGDYIAFLDADDFISPDFCQRLLSFAMDHKLDLVACNALMVNTTGDNLRTLYCTFPSMINVSLSLVLKAKHIQAYFEFALPYIAVFFQQASIDFGTTLPNCERNHH